MTKVKPKLKRNFHSPARFKGEDFEQYKIRRKASQESIKRRIKSTNSVNNPHKYFFNKHFR